MLDERLLFKAVFVLIKNRMFQAVIYSGIRTRPSRILPKRRIHVFSVVRLIDHHPRGLVPLGPHDTANATCEHLTLSTHQKSLISHSSITHQFLVNHSANISSSIHRTIIKRLSNNASTMLRITNQTTHQTRASNNASNHPSSHPSNHSPSHSATFGVIHKSLIKLVIRLSISFRFFTAI